MNEDPILPRSTISDIKSGSDAIEEYIDNTPTDIEIEDTSPEIDTIKPWDPEQIRIHTRHFSIRQMMDMIDDGDVDLAPDFQRQYVWKHRQRCGLIESILLGIPLPSFYLNEDRDGKMQVVDGVQRLTSIHKFYKNEITLDHLGYLKSLNDKKFEDMEATVFGRRLKNTQLVAHVIDPQTPRRVKYDVFKRLNTGGSPLTAQEIRHCMSHNRSREFLKRIVELKEFASVMGPAVVKHLRMADREIALRLIAFHVVELDDYHKFESLDGFLGEVTYRLDDPGEISDEKIFELENLARTALINAKAVFGDHAFRKWPQGQERKTPISRALVESFGAALSTVEPAQAAKYAGKLIELSRDTMTNDLEFIESISQSTGAVRRVKTRMETAARLVREALR